jgi:hypothetical protein
MSTTVTLVVRIVSLRVSDVYVHSTRVFSCVVMLISFTKYWCRRLCSLSTFVYNVTCSSFDVVVLWTLLVTIVVV